MNVRFRFWKEGKRKALTMSYDDGNVADRRLVEIFNQYGIKGSFHLNAGRFSDWTIAPEEIPALYAGHEVSAHTLTHPFLTCVPREQIYEEVLEDRRRLESICGYPVCGASYPQGAYSDEVVELLRSLGYRYCRTTKATERLSIPNDFLLWNPTCHHKDPQLLQYLADLKKSTRPLALLYVWGHSYEFDRNDNWELIETFCREAGGDEDIWYATNIEIYDYVCALRALRFSVDRTMVFNPTSFDLWIEADHVCVKVPAGATLCLENEVKKHESEEK